MARVDYQEVPEQQAREEAPDDLQHIEASPAAFGAEAAAGAESLGAGALDASKFYGTVAADNATNNFLDQRTKLLYGDPSQPLATDSSGQPILAPDGAPARSGGFFALRGADAMREAPEVSQQLNDIIQENRRGLSTPESQLQYDTDTRRYRAQTMQDIGTHTDQQQKIWASDTNNTAAVLALNAIGSTPLNQDVVGAQQENVNRAYVRNAQLAGEDPRGALLKAKQDVTYVRIKSLLVSNPAAAQDLLNSDGQVLASRPDYDAISRAVKEGVINGQLAPATDDFISNVKADAQQSTAGAVASLKANPYNLGNVKTANLQGFEQPATPADGVMLTANNLRSADYHGLTLQQIGAKWEGTSPQNIQNWIKNVSKESGIAPGTVPNLNDPATLSKLMTGISVAEKTPGERTAFTPSVINQGVTASLAGQKPQLGQAQGGGYASIADYYAMNEGVILDKASEQAGRLFPNYPDAQERFVTNVSRHLSQTISQQHAQYEVDVHTVEQAFASGHPPITEDQLNAVSPDVAAAWNRMQIDSPYNAAAVQNRFAAAAKGQAKTYGTQFSAMLNRVLAPVGDPNRINNAAELWPYIQPGEDGALTNTGANALSSIMERRQGASGESDTAMLRNFLTSAHHMINPIQNENLGIFYPDGEKEYQRFVGQALRQIDAEEKAGKPLAQILKDKGDVYNSMFSGGFVPSQEKLLDAKDPEKGKVIYNPALKHAQQLDAVAKQAKTPADLEAARVAGKISLQERNSLAIQKGFARATPPPQAPGPQVPLPQ